MIFLRCYRLRCLFYLFFSCSIACAQSRFDADRDGDVDLADYAAFAQRFGQTRRHVDVWPWLEVNVNSDPRIDAAVSGLQVWQNTTKTVIITTRPGLAVVYRRLREALPTLRIIPGLKTSSLLPRFDSIDGWEAIAREVENFIAATNDNRFVFEHEGALRGLWNGDYQLDIAQYAEALRSLPRSIEYIWYPGLVGENARTIAAQTTTCRIAQHIIGVRFVDLSWSSPADVRARQRDDVAARIRIAQQAARLPMIPIIYSLRHETRGEIYWPPRRLFEAVHLPGEPVVIVYPGAARWVEAAKQLYR